MIPTTAERQTGENPDRCKQDLPSFCLTAEDSLWTDRLLTGGDNQTTTFRRSSGQPSKTVAEMAKHALGVKSLSGTEIVVKLRFQQG